MGWQGWVELLGVLVVLALVLPVVWVIVRRRWLARQGGTFDCSFRMNDSTPSSGWVLGVARYRGEFLEWYRLFAFGPRPRLRFERRSTMAVGQREPGAAEEKLLYDQRHIVVLEQRATQREPREMAMSGDSLTGLLSWLEAAPPGEGRYGDVAD